MSRAQPASGWRRITTATSDLPGLFPVVVARFHQPTLEGEPEGSPELLWAYVAYPGHSGGPWMMNSRGMAGLHGNASFPIDAPTHWIPLDQTLPHDPA
jgi:hypothetical protein